MKWLRTVVIFMAITGLAVISANFMVNEMTAIEQLQTADADYEYSPAELKQAIKIHISFYKKIRDMLSDLISELRPYLKNEDAAGFKETIDVLLDQYSASINHAVNALKADDIKGAKLFLLKATKDLGNLYVVQEVLLKLKNEIMPRKNNNGIIKSASIPKDIIFGDFLFRKILVPLVRQVQNSGLEANNPRFEWLKLPFAMPVAA